MDNEASVTGSKRSSSGKNPGYALVIVGPRGVGKTRLAQLVADACYLPLAVTGATPRVMWLDGSTSSSLFSAVTDALAHPDPHVRGYIIETEKVVGLNPDTRRFLVIRIGEDHE